MGIQETGPRGGVNLNLALRTFLRHGQNIFQSVTEQNKTCCCQVEKTTPIFSAPVFLLSLYFFLSPPILLRVFDEVLFLGTTMNTLPTMPKQLLLKADHTDFSLGVVVAALHTRQEVVCRVHSRAPPLSKCGLRPWNLAQIVWARLGLL